MANEKNSKRLPGFYIALCCCVLVIGIAGYFTERQESNTAPTDTTRMISKAEIPGEEIPAATVIPEGEVISVSEITPVFEEATAAPTAAPTEAPAEYTLDNPDVMETAVRVEAEELVFAMPASGDILAEYSAELSFNEALGDYRAHNGIDIAADEGCSISAAADGTIEDIYSNAFGDGVTISHANGITTKYMCLGGVENFKAGDEVKAGDVIGTVGKSKGESVTEPHLHFELYKDNTPANPMDYLK